MPSRILYKTTHRVSLKMVLWASVLQYHQPQVLHQFSLNSLLIFPLIYKIWILIPSRKQFLSSWKKKDIWLTRNLIHRPTHHGQRMGMRKWKQQVMEGTHMVSDNRAPHRNVSSIGQWQMGRMTAGWQQDDSRMTAGWQQHDSRMTAAWQQDDSFSMY